MRRACLQPHGWSSTASTQPIASSSGELRPLPWQDNQRNSRPRCEKPASPLRSTATASQHRSAGLRLRIPDAHYHDARKAPPPVARNQPHRAPLPIHAQRLSPPDLDARSPRATNGMITRSMHAGDRADALAPSSRTRTLSHDASLVSGADMKLCRSTRTPPRPRTEMSGCHNLP